MRDQARAYPLLPDTTHEEPREETPLLVDGETEPSIMTLAATSHPPPSPLRPLMVRLIGKLSIAEIVKGGGSHHDVFVHSKFTE